VNVPGVVFVWALAAVYCLVDGLRLTLSEQARERRYARGRVWRALWIDSPEDLRSIGRGYIGLAVVLVGFVVLVEVRTT
jgi:hypothetical protein